MAALPPLPFLCDSFAMLSLPCMLLWLPCHLCHFYVIASPCYLAMNVDSFAMLSVASSVCWVGSCHAIFASTYALSLALCFVVEPPSLVVLFSSCSATNVVCSACIRPATHASRSVLCHVAARLFVPVLLPVLRRFSFLLVIYCPATFSMIR